MYTVTTAGKSTMEKVLNLSLKVFKQSFARDVLFKEDVFAYKNARIIVKKPGNVVSTVFVIPRVMYMNGVELKLGGIGGVATDPSERGMGHAGTLMKDAVAFMKKEKYDVSLLFPFDKNYYAKFGYRDFYPEVRFLPARRKKTSSRLYTVRPFNEARDLDAIVSLYNTFNSNMIGTVKRDKNYFKLYLKKNKADTKAIYVALDGTSICAYIMISGITKSHKDRDFRLKIGEYGFFAGCDSAMELLFEKAANYAAAHSSAGLYYEPVYPPAAGKKIPRTVLMDFDNKHLKMYRIVNFASFLSKMSPLWRRRSNSNWRKLISLKRFEKNCQCSVELKGLSSGAALLLDEKDFVGLCFGYIPFGALRQTAKGFNAQEKRLMETIFVRKKPVFWDFDYL